MPNVDDLRTSRYLKKEEFEAPVLVTIERYAKEDVSMQDQRAEMKWVLYFKELEKGLALNVTNGERIEEITESHDFDGWIGKQVVLFNDKTVRFGDKKGGIRVRAPKNAVQQAADEAKDAHERKLQDQMDDAEAEQTF